MSERILKRTLSSSSTLISDEIHNYIMIQRDYFLSNDMSNLIMDTKTSTVTIPNDIKQYNLKILCDEIKLKALATNGVLNWCVYCRPLCPINTDNDGNSLLHSLSLYIFGVHDRHNYLRQILSFRMNKEKLDGEMGIRWIEHSLHSNLLHGWNRLQELTSDRKYFYSDKTTRFGELGSFHVFVMANILGRAIIVLTEKQFDDTIGGIYLPLLRKSNEFFRSPIVLVYYNCNFSPAFSCDSIYTMLSDKYYTDSALHCVPLVNSDLIPLKVHFLLPRENQDKILPQFLDISYIEDKIKVAFLNFKLPLANSVELLNLFSKTDFDMVESNVSNKNKKDVINIHHSVNFTQNSAKQTNIGIENKKSANSNNISTMIYLPPDSSDKMNAGYYNEFPVHHSTKTVESIRSLKNPQTFENCYSYLINSPDKNQQMCSKCRFQTVNSLGICLSCHQNSVACMKYSKDNFINEIKTHDNNLLRNNVDLMTPCSTFGCAKFTYLPSSKCQSCQEKENQSDTFNLNCLKNDCNFYGNPEYNGLCSRCFMKMTISEAMASSSAKSVSSLDLSTRSAKRQATKYNPKNDFKKCNLRIENLDDDVDDDGLHRLFSHFGKIVSAKLMTYNNGASKGYGFVCYETNEEASKAISSMNGVTLFSKKKLVVTYYEQQQKVKNVEGNDKEVEKECCICYNALTTRIVFDPCGHSCVCDVCVTELNEKCPICREKIIKYIKAYI